MPLTKRQKEILDYIESFIDEQGYAPSFEEIAESFGYSSLATVHEHLSNLERKGYIRKSYNESRSIELVGRETATPVVELPLLGAVAAGLPIEAIEDTETLAVPPDMVSRRRDNYVLRGIDLQIVPREVVVLIGPSGSGKSTVLRTVNLLEEPTEGDVWFDGTQLTDIRTDLDEARTHMGMVFQQFNLFPHLKVIENVTLAQINPFLVTESCGMEGSASGRLVSEPKSSIAPRYCNGVMFRSTAEPQTGCATVQSPTRTAMAYHRPATTSRWGEPLQCSSKLQPSTVVAYTSIHGPTSVSPSNTTRSWAQPIKSAITPMSRISVSEDNRACGSRAVLTRRASESAPEPRALLHRNRASRVCSTRTSEEAPPLVGVNSSRRAEAYSRSPQFPSTPGGPEAMHPEILEQRPPPLYRRARRTQPSGRLTHAAFGLVQMQHGQRAAHVVAVRTLVHDSLQLLSDVTWDLRYTQCHRAASSDLG